MGGSRTARARSGRHRVYDLIRAQIIRLELSPGAVLSENELAAAFGVSRTPVREALLLLAKEGLVQVFPKVGTFVSRVDPEQVAEAQFLREAVELASLRSLTQPFDPDAITALRDNLDRQDRVGDDLAAFFALDEAFHRGLMAMAGHEVSWTSVAAAKAHLDRARMLGLRTFTSSANLAAEHRAVVDAVVSGDLIEAEERLRAHLRTVFADIKAIEAASPELFAAAPHAQPVRRSVVVWE